MFTQPYYYCVKMWQAPMPYFYTVRGSITHWGSTNGKDQKPTMKKLLSFLVRILVLALCWFFTKGFAFFLMMLSVAYVIVRMHLRARLMSCHACMSKKQQT